MRLSHLHNSVCCEYDVDALFTFMEATLLVTGGGGWGEDLFAVHCIFS